MSSGGDGAAVPTEYMAVCPPGDICINPDPWVNLIIWLGTMLVGGFVFGIGWSIAQSLLGDSTNSSKGDSTGNEI